MSPDAPGRPAVKLFYREAIARAIGDAMAQDRSVLVLGQDVSAFGGAYREFSGLSERFGMNRVRDMPVAEASIIGVAAGAAAAGLRPLASITYMDFLMLALDPLVNYAAKARFKTGGQLRAPMVVKTTAGAKGQGVAHSQCIEAWLMGVPGLKVVAPATANDAYWLMRASLEADGPVVYIDHKRLFATTGEVDLSDPAAKLGEAAVLRAGSDLTLVSHSYMTKVAMEAAELLQRAGVSVEVIDLRSLWPLDIETVCASVARTGALVTLEEGQTVCGVGAEVASAVQERIGLRRLARVGALRAPVSSNPVLEAACLPDADRVVAAALVLLGVKPMLAKGQNA